MNVLPVAIRDLREQARRSNTMWLRIAGGFAAISVFAMFSLNSHVVGPAAGERIFMLVHGTLMIVVWGLVPATVADAIAGERRDGTLPLLFLTPLSAWDVVIGKWTAHGLRAFLVLLAALPVQTVPLLLGGVTWLDAVTAFCFQGTSLLVAIAAGLVASSRCRHWIRAAVLSVVVAAGLGVIVMAVLGSLFGMLSTRLSLREADWMERLAAGYYLLAGGLTGWGGAWSDLLNRLGMGNEWLLVLLGMVVFSLTATGILLAACSRILRRTWREGIRPAWMEWAGGMFTREILLARFIAGRKRAALDRNPIAWLHTRSWNGRLTKWGWCLAVVGAQLVAIVMLDFQLTRLARVQVALATALLFGIGFAGVASFTTEKRSGALELLLISPLPIRTLIVGRVSALWRQFLPAVLVIGALWSYDVLLDRDIARWNHGQANEAASLLILFVIGLTLPVVSLYCALRERRIVVACVLCGLMGFLVPFMFGTMGGGLLRDILVERSIIDWGLARMVVPGTICVAQVSFALLAVFLLHHSLSRRIYAF